MLAASCTVATPPPTATDPTLPTAVAAAAATTRRYSQLLAPIMLLEGHAAAVYTARFAPSGRHLVSGSHDATLLVWEVFGDCRNVLTLRGHANAVLEAQWLSDGERIASASADKTAALWDAQTGARLRRFRGHSSHVNGVCAARDGVVLATASDDGTARIWDARAPRRCQRTLVHAGVAVTAVTLSAAGTEAYTGALDGRVRVFDLRKEADDATLALAGHRDIVTGVSLSPDGRSLLSNAMDATLRRWDVRPYCATDRCEQIYTGAQHNFERTLIRCSWSPAGERVAAGSSDHCAYVWDANSGRICYKLPGHTGSVNEVCFHPTQPVVASCSNDKCIYLGEVQPFESLAREQASQADDIQMKGVI